MVATTAAAAPTPTWDPSAEDSWVCVPAVGPVQVLTMPRHLSWTLIPQSAQWDPWRTSPQSACWHTAQLVWVVKVHTAQLWESLLGDEGFLDVGCRDDFFKNRSSFAVLPLSSLSGAPRVCLLEKMAAAKEAKASLKNI